MDKLNEEQERNLKTKEEDLKIEDKNLENEKEKKIYFLNIFQN